MDLVELLVALAIVVGLVGIVVPILPGSVLVLIAVLVWATDNGARTAWVVFAVAAVLIVTGQIVKYVVPGRGLRSSGVPNRSLILGGLLGIVGFFVIPVLGLVVGFVGGVYLAELQRVGGQQAWPSTRAALKAVGVSILVELVAALLASAVWLAGAIAV